MEQLGTPMEIDNTQFLNRKQQENNFQTIEKIFRDQISKYPDIERTINICCDDDIESSFIDLGERIKRTYPYDTLSNSDLYLTLIYIYYSLVAGEQTEDIFDINFLRYYAINKDLVQDLYLKITTGDIIESNGRNLSRDIRRGLLGFFPVGGKNKIKRRRKKTNRKSHNKKKKRKTNKHLRSKK